MTAARSLVSLTWSLLITVVTHGESVLRLMQAQAMVSHEMVPWILGPQGSSGFCLVHENNVSQGLWQTVQQRHRGGFVLFVSRCTRSFLSCAACACSRANSKPKTGRCCVESIFRCPTFLKKVKNIKRFQFYRIHLSRPFAQRD